MTMARFDWEARMRKGKARVRLIDPAGRTVAEGTGKSVSIAQQDALEHAKNEDARLYLQQVKFPNGPTKKARRKKKSK
jgi:hypothetical protein